MNADPGPSTRAHVTAIQASNELDQALEATGLQAWGPTVLWIGGAAKLQPAAQDAGERMAALTAGLVERHHGAVVDGATAVGVMRAMGTARQRGGHRFPLVGVAPEALVVRPGEAPKPNRYPLDPNHSHFVLVPGRKWGDEVALMSRTVDLIAGEFPSLTVLFNGGNIAGDEVEQSLAAGRPVLVLKGTGRLADELASKPPANPLLQVIGILEEDRLKAYVEAKLKGEET